jgi:hypothetical protein
MVVNLKRWSLVTSAATRLASAATNPDAAADVRRL